MAGFRNLFFSILVCILYFGCDNKIELINEDEAILQEIRKCYAKTAVLKLPFTWKNSTEEFPYPLERLGEQHSLFCYDNHTEFSIGAALPDTSNYYIFLLVCHWDSLTLPAIATFDKQGNRISFGPVGYISSKDSTHFGDSEFRLEKNLIFYSTSSNYEKEKQSVIFRKYEKKGRISPKGKVTEDNGTMIEMRKIDKNSPENPFK